MSRRDLDSPLNSDQAQPLDASNSFEDYSPSWREILFNRRQFPPLVKQIQESVYQGIALGNTLKLQRFSKIQHHHIIPINAYLDFERDSLSTEVLDVAQIKYGDRLMSSKSGKLLTQFFEYRILHPHDLLNCIPVGKEFHNYFDKCYWESSKDSLDTIAYLLATNSIRVAGYFDSDDADYHINGFSNKQRLAYMLANMNIDFQTQDTYGQYEEYMENANFLARASKRYLNSLEA